ncbi:MAG TPA: hypothetical protein DCY35_12115 [Prolixibacteraceae bacterium]|nr:hypothetical protein [Prolixibacteraceae bacterium]
MNTGTTERFLFNDGFQVAEGNWIQQEGGNFKPVRIPHDHAITQDRGKQYKGYGSQGFVDCFHTITYRKNFHYIRETGPERLWLLFDGVFRRSEVYVNGKLAGKRPYGYVSFYYDITALVVEGKNLLEVLVDNSQPPADRWYSGMGIYRDVYLLKTSDVHIKHYGTYITTPQISDESAQVDIRYEVVRHSGPCEVEIRTEILYEDQVVAVSAVAGTQEVIADTLYVQEPKRWDIDNPSLYQVKSFVYVQGILKDTYESTFGIRDIRYDTDKGMFLNGRLLKLKGVNLHHDWGCMGSAFLRDAWKKRILALKDIGVNAIRCSHNPQAEIFYELCDETGILVFDEAFDKWHWDGGWYKDHFDEWWEKDLVAMLERDRNHPCVFVWSVGNEVENQGTDWMMETLGKLADYVKAFEPTRPVTFAINPADITIDGQKLDMHDLKDHMEDIVGLIYKMSRKVDILSCNYQEQWYAAYRQAFQDRLIIGSEVYQYYTGEGPYFDNLVEKHPWSYVKDNDFVIGSFFWAGVDYLGESASGWPARGWSSCMLDLAGFERPSANHSRALWLYQPVAKLVVFDEKQMLEKTNACWSYPKCVDHMMIDRERGEVVRAGVYTNCESVELITGKRSYGERLTRNATNNLVRFNLVYAGNDEITIIGRNQGVEVVRETVKPFGAPKDIEVTSDKTVLTQSVHDLAFVTVKLMDENGIWNRNAELEIKIKVSGNLELVGLDNGNILSLHDYHASSIRTFKGKCLIVVRADGKGEGTLRIQAQNLQSERLLKFECRE